MTTTVFDKAIDLLQVDENNRWAIGGAINRGLRNGGSWADLEKVLADRGLDFQVSTLRVYSRVTAAFPVEDRIPGVSFAAHQAALTVGDATKGRQAIQNVRDAGHRVTRDTVLAEVRKMKGRTGSQTSDAVAAWRDLRRGVEKLLDLSTGELAALLTLDGGKYAGQASKLSRDLGRVSVKVSEALTKAEKANQAKAKRTAAAVASAGTTKPKTSKAPASAPKVPKLGRLGSGRGQAT